jgi:hypothetical protein
MTNAISDHRRGGRIVVTGRPVTGRGRLSHSALPRKTFRSTVCFGVALLVAACQTVDYTRVQPLDNPQSLVGEWRGEAALEHNPGAAAVMVLTITRVEGDRVFGSVESWGAGWGTWGVRHHTRTFQARP